MSEDLFSGRVTGGVRSWLRKLGGAIVAFLFLEPSSSAEQAVQSGTATCLEPYQLQGLPIQGRYIVRGRCIFVMSSIPEFPGSEQEPSPEQMMALLAQLQAAGHNLDEISPDLSVRRHSPCGRGTSCVQQCSMLGSLSGMSAWRNCSCLDRGSLCEDRSHGSCPRGPCSFQELVRKVKKEKGQPTEDVPMEEITPEPW